MVLRPAFLAFVIVLVWSICPAIGAEPLPKHCQSQTKSTLQIHLPRLPELATPEQRSRHTCPAWIVTKALGSNTTVSLHNVILSGSVDLAEVPLTSCDALDIGDNQRKMLNEVLRRRPREHSPCSVRVVPEIEILDSWIENITNGRFSVVFPRPTRLTGTAFTGAVDLQAAVFLGPLSLIRSRFEGPTSFLNAAFDDLFASGGTVRRRQIREDDVVRARLV